MKIFKSLRKRGLALFLVLTMCLSMIPTTAFAYESDHVHNEDGYTCEFEQEGTQLICEATEHKHGDGCYQQAEPQLICTETEHTHGDECKDSETGEIICTVGEHEHGDACYRQAEAQLICTETEHTHGEECYEAVGHWHCTPPVTATVPTEVQAFLDAVAALPDLSTVTTANAEAIGEQVNAVIDMAEVLDDDLYLSDEVQDALNGTVYPLFQAVLAAEEVEDGETFVDKDTLYGGYTTGAMYAPLLQGRYAPAYYRNVNVSCSGPIEASNPYKTSLGFSANAYRYALTFSMTTKEVTQAQWATVSVSYEYTYNATLGSATWFRGNSTYQVKVIPNTLESTENITLKVGETATAKVQPSIYLEDAKFPQGTLNGSFGMSRERFVGSPAAISADSAYATVANSTILDGTNGCEVATDVTGIKAGTTTALLTYSFRTPVGQNLFGDMQYVTIRGTHQVNITVTATCTVTWVNWDGTSLYVKENVPVDAVTASDYKGDTPTRPSAGGYDYTFNGWSVPVTDDNGDVTFTAQFTPTEQKTYAVKWMEVDAEMSEWEIEWSSLHAETNVIADREPEWDYVKANNQLSDPQTYTDPDGVTHVWTGKWIMTWEKPTNWEISNLGWDPDLDVKVYRAEYAEKTYHVTWQEPDGSKTYQGPVDLPKSDIEKNHPETTPEKPGYKFDGWEIGEPDDDDKIIVKPKWTPLEPVKDERLVVEKTAVK